VTFTVADDTAASNVAVIATPVATSVDPDAGDEVSRLGPETCGWKTTSTA
jgi:hypothetical protein